MSRLGYDEEWTREQLTAFWAEREQKNIEALERAHVRESRRLNNARVIFYIVGACAGAAIAFISWHSTLAYKTDIKESQESVSRETSREHELINDDIKQIQEVLEKQQRVTENVRENIARLMWNQGVKSKPVPGEK